MHLSMSSKTNLGKIKRINVTNNKANKNYKIYLLLLFSVFMISFDTVIFKTAAGYPTLSKEFIMWYALALVIYFFYAIFWQIILKHFPLSIAYSVRCIVVILGLIWSVLIFNQKITVFNIIGAALILVGVFLATKVRGEEEQEEAAE